MKLGLPDSPVKLVAIAFLGGCVTASAFPLILASLGSTLIPRLDIMMSRLKAS